MNTLPANTGMWIKKDDSRFLMASLSGGACMWIRLQHSRSLAMSKSESVVDPMNTLPANTGMWIKKDDSRFLMASLSGGACK